MVVAGVMQYKINFILPIFIFTKRFSNFFCGAIADIFFLVGFGHVPPLKIKV